MLYLPPYTISNRLQRAWLNSVSFQVSRLCRSGIIVGQDCTLGHPWVNCGCILQVACGHVGMSKSIAVCCCECHNSLACLIVFYAALYQRPSISPAELNEFVYFASLLVVSSTVSNNWVSQDLLALNPCCESDSICWIFRCFMILEFTICSKHSIDVNDTGR